MVMDDPILDHTDLMYANPKKHGYDSEEELEGLTLDEMQIGATKNHMFAYGEWLLAHAVRNLKRASLRIHA